jgi:hypothetical protein
MKTTVDLPEDLVIAAKKRAVETRGTLRELIERGLRRELDEPVRPPAGRAGIRWVTAPGGLPAGLDLTDRAAMREWLRRER